MKTDYKYINFAEEQECYKCARKTRSYAIYNTRSGAFIGEAKWYGPWRQYCFFPGPATVFSVGCMADISDFIKQLMDERKGQLHKAL